MDITLKFIQDKMLLRVHKMNKPSLEQKVLTFLLNGIFASCLLIFASNLMNGIVLGLFESSTIIKKGVMSYKKNIIYIHISESSS